MIDKAFHLWYNHINKRKGVDHHDHQARSRPYPRPAQAIATVYNIVRKLAGEEESLVSTTTRRSISMDDIFTTLDILEAIQENNKWADGK